MYKEELRVTDLVTILGEPSDQRGNYVGMTASIQDIVRNPADGRCMLQILFLDGSQIGRGGCIPQEAVKKIGETTPIDKNKPKGRETYGKQEEQEPGGEKQKRSDVQAREEPAEDTKTARATEATVEKHHSDADSERDLERKKTEAKQKDKKEKQEKKAKEQKKTRADRPEADRPEAAQSSVSTARAVEADVVVDYF